jgi:glycosyltransferase involved in cell wall biosynthesis
VVVPVYNGASTLGPCLQALRAAVFEGVEVLFVDDGSTDETASMIERAGFRSVATPRQSGPAVARNLGVEETRAPLLFFTDADVEVGPDTLRRVVELFEADPGLDALFGSYASTTPAEGFLSDYKNLTHHWTHQNARERAGSFWTGCGAVRREVFEAMGGFDVSYDGPQIEDIELGVRMAEAGHAIRVVKDLQVVHHKHYDLAGLFRSDAYNRALPWTLLMLRSGNNNRDLNTKRRDALGLAAAWLLPASLLFPPATAAVGGVYLACNARLLAYLLRERGPAYALKGLGARWLYHLAGGVGLGLALVHHGRARLGGGG